MRKIYLIFMLFAFVFSASAQTQLDDYKICLDPGHGGHEGDDRQTILANGVVYWESEGVLEVAKHLDTLLSDLGADVKLTRLGNTGEYPDDLSLSQRYIIANNFGADYFQSIHTNGFNGTSNYTIMLYRGDAVGTPTWPEAEKMCDIMSPIVYDLLKTTHHSVEADKEHVGFNYGVLAGTNMPASLSEGAFHDYPEQGLRLKNTESLKNYAWGLAKSFLQYYNAGEMPLGRFTGIISDKTTGKPINGATIALKQAVKATTTINTDAYYNGFYGFDLETGNYTFTVSKEGYTPEDVTIDVTANEHTSLDIALTYSNGGDPIADFYFTSTPTTLANNATFGDLISFNSSTSQDHDGTITDYAWDFGDGEISAIANPGHTYAADGVYNIVLTVTDNEGKTSSITKKLEITAITISGLPAGLGETVSFNASNNDAAETLTYEWNFGDGNTGTGKNTSHIYAADKSYTVTLTIKDGGTTVSLATKEFDVNSNFNIVGLPTGLGDELTFTAANPDITGTTLTYDWDFGNGNIGSGKSATQIFVKDGDYVITLTVKNGTEIVSSSTKEIKINSAFDIVGLPGGYGKELTFTATNPDITGVTLTYEWAFGDENTSTGKSTQHSYDADNTYIVTLTVKNGTEVISTTTEEIHILRVAPITPTLLSVQNVGDDIKVTWVLNPESNAAYKLYVSNSDALDDFTVLADETTLIVGTQEYMITSPTLNAQGYNFKLSAINEDGESDFSDTYSRVSTSVADAKTILIVDGLDRGGSIHALANRYMLSLRDAGDVIVSSAANEAIISNSVILGDYDIVVWFVGDESTADHTFDASEQAKVKTYLEAGGNLLVSGSEIAWDLGHKNNGKAFFNDYLKAAYVSDGASSGYTPATGITATDFAGVSLVFSNVPYPDVMATKNGSEYILKYSNSKNAGVAYKGIFGSSSEEGGMVYLGFPIEDVGSNTAITTFMEKVLAYFLDTPNSIQDISNSSVNLFPVPATNELSIQFNDNLHATTEILIYDFSGKKVYSTSIDKAAVGESYRIDISTLNSGLYILKAQSLDFNFSKKFVKK